MTLHVGPIEWLWIVSNAAGFGFFFWAWIDARRDQAVVLSLNGEARELTAAGDVRRNKWRTVSALLLLVVSLPQAFSDREIVLTPGLGALLLVPLVYVYVALRDRLDRRALLRMKIESIEADRLATVDRLETGLARLEHVAEENLAATHMAAEASSHAAEAANLMNEKWLAGQTRADASELLAAERADASDVYNADAHVIRKDTSERVTKIGERILKQDEDA